MKKLKQLAVKNGRGIILASMIVWFAIGYGLGKLINMIDVIRQINILTPITIGSILALTLGLSGALLIIFYSDEGDLE